MTQILSGFSNLVHLPCHHPAKTHYGRANPPPHIESESESRETQEVGDIVPVPHTAEIEKQKLNSLYVGLPQAPPKIWTADGK